MIEAGIGSPRAGPLRSVQLRALNRDLDTNRFSRAVWICMTKFESDSIRRQAVFRIVHADVVGRFTLCAWATVCSQCTGRDLIAMLLLPPSFAGSGCTAYLCADCSVKLKRRRKKRRRAFRLPIHQALRPGGTDVMGGMPMCDPG